MTSLQRTSPQDGGLLPDRVQTLRRVLQDEIDRQRLPGAVAMISRGGRIGLFESFGRLDPASSQAMGDDAIFRIYSMTKPLVSVAILMLMEQGRLLLSDPVTRFLPEFAGQQVSVESGGVAGLEPAQRVPTVQDLLRHTAGLTYEFLGASAVQRAYAQERIGSRERSNRAFSQALAAIPLAYQPGTVWEYSRATDVLGCVIEAVTGQTLGAALQQMVLGPLGMVDTAFAVPQKDHHRIAEPFAKDPDCGIAMRVLEPRETPGMESGGGGLMSTAIDYARFLQCMLNRGELDGMRLLGSRTVDFMTADHLGSMPVRGDLLPPGHGFGLGFAVRTAAGLSPVPGSVGLYYWGGIAGTTFFVDPKEDLFAMLMIQAPNQRDYYRPLFRSLVYAALSDGPRLPGL